MLEKGLVQIYTTDSEEMNFAPIGLSLRAAGHNLRTLITCFISHPLMGGAPMASSLLKPYIHFDLSALEHPWSRSNEKIGNMNAIGDAFDSAREAIFSKDFDIVILNGIHRLLDQGLISLEDFLTLLKEKPRGVELILSGTRIPEQIIEKADLVTDMQCFLPEEISGKQEYQNDSSSIEVVTGNAKGKTTYCLGKALLLSCMGKCSIILQFIKSPTSYGEVKAIGRIPNMEIKAMGEGLLSRGSKTRSQHLEAAGQAWSAACAKISSGQGGSIVLDEINIATYYGFIPGERVRDMLIKKHPNLHLILSGRDAHFEVREAASSVIEMREIKHPYKKGINARKGIEF